MNEPMRALWQSQEILATENLKALLQDEDELKRRIAWLRLPENAQAFPRKDYAKIYESETLVVQSAIIETMQSLVNTGAVSAQECLSWFEKLMRSGNPPAGQFNELLSLSLLKAFFGIRILTDSDMLNFYESCAHLGTEFLSVFFNRLSKRVYLLKGEALQSIIFRHFNEIKERALISPDQIFPSFFEELIVCAARGGKIKLIYDELQNLAKHPPDGSIPGRLAVFQEMLAREAASFITKEAADPELLFEFDESFLRLALNFVRPAKWSLAYWKKVLAKTESTSSFQQSLLLGFLQLQSWLYRDVLMNLLEQERRPQAQLQLLRLLHSSLSATRLSGRRIPFAVLFTLLKNAVAQGNREIMEIATSILKIDSPSLADMNVYSQWLFDEVTPIHLAFPVITQPLSVWCNKEAVHG